MNRFVIMFAAILCAQPLWAQRAATFTATNFAAEGGIYSFDIYGLSTGSPVVRLGTSSFYFNYNSTALSTPTLSNINPKYTGLSGISDYEPMTVGVYGPSVGVTVEYTANGGGQGEFLSTTGPLGELLCTVSMTIVNSSLSANLSWNLMDSDALNSFPLATISTTFVGSDESPLPIQLVNFTATSIGGNRVALEWTTLSETNNYGFEVQKAPGQPQGFTTISNSFIQGHGTTNEPHTYTYIDESAAVGVWYYRLKQIDLDGGIHYSDPVQVEVLTGVAEKPVPTVYSLDQNYPNPFNPATVIDFALPQQSHVKLEVYNIIGQKVATLVDEIRQVGYYSEMFDAKNLASGLYFYRLSTNEVSFLKKMTILK